LVRSLRRPLLSLAFAIGACAAPVERPLGPSRALDSADPIDPVGRLTSSAKPLATPCTLSVAGVMTVTVLAGETAIVSMRASDKAVLQNGETCVDATGAPTTAIGSGGAANLKKLLVVGAGPGVTVVIDGSNGLFARGASETTPFTSYGIVVNLGLNEATSALAIKTTSNADTVVIGAGIAGTVADHGALSLDGQVDKFPDVAIHSHGVHRLIVSLGEGADQVSAAGTAQDTAIGALGGPYVATYAGGLALYGGGGDDVFHQGDDANAAPFEALAGGPGFDTVDYAARTRGLLLSLGGPAGVAAADDGDPTYASGAGERDAIDADVEKVLAGSGADTLSSFATASCAGGCVTLEGGAGDDWFLQGASASFGERLIGGLGVDTVDYSLRGASQPIWVTIGASVDDGEAGEGDDLTGSIENVYGGAGNDTITGSALANTLVGGLGDDVLHGGAGDDRFLMAAWDGVARAFLAGPDGADLIVGDEGNDTVDYGLRAGAVTARLHDGSVDDPYAGDSGHAPSVGVASDEGDDLRVEALRGSATAPNALFACATTASVLSGGAASDTLTGGGGADTLDGGSAGADVIACGGGVDVVSALGADAGREPNHDGQCEHYPRASGSCGDGVAQDFEACDDGGQNGAATCAYGLTSCTLCDATCVPHAGAASYCGDGVVNGAEGCDLGAQNGVTACAYGANSCAICDGACQPGAGATRFCGDGVVDPEEACDDGNATAGDGCSAACAIEAGFVCLGAPSVCTPPSCAGGGAGLDDCGALGDERCCASPLVPGGTFLRSYDAVSTDYKNPLFTAWVSTHRLDRFEVTVGRFRRFVAAVVAGWTPSAGAGKHAHLNGGSGLAAVAGGYEPGWDVAWNAYLPSTQAGWDDASVLACDPALATWTSAPGPNERRPINCLDWYEAAAFCIWDGGFLPSETEWNYAAAGGGNQRVYPWSSPSSSAALDATRASWFVDATIQCGGDGVNGCTLDDLLFVGSKPAGDGRFGQADLAGNVAEPTLDWFAGGFATYANYSCNDCAYLWPGTARVMRGGAFDRPAAMLAASYRDPQAPSDRRVGFGVRCARRP
jgi:cysteine-rich repeat protein